MKRIKRALEVSYNANNGAINVVSDTDEATFLGHQIANTVKHLTNWQGYTELVAAATISGCRYYIVER